MLSMEVINLTKDLDNEIMFSALDYWKDIELSDLDIMTLPGHLGNRKHTAGDTSDLAGMSLKGFDFRTAECRSSMKLIHPDNTIIKDYVSLMKGKHGIVSFSGCHYMDQSGFIQWHSNQFDRPGFNYRIYVTYNDKEGSLFKYILPDTDVVITYVEPKGWYAKVFNIEKELIHCVESHANRYSIGLYF